MSRLGSWPGFARIEGLPSALLDQATLSGANFLMTVTLVAYLPAAEFGVFSISFAAVIFLTGFQNALVLEPLSVQLGKMPPAEAAAYLGRLNRFSWALALSSAVILWVVATLWGGPFRLPGRALACAVPVLLWHGLLRRICYVRHRPGLAARASVVYLGVLAVALVLLGLSGSIAVWTAIAALATAAGVSALFLRRALPSPWQPWRRRHSNCSGYWEYTRWVLLSTVVHWLVAWAYIPVVGVILGLEAAGGLRFLFLLIQPLQLGLASAGALVLPRMAAEAGSSLRQWRHDLLVALATPAALYGLGVFLMGPFLSPWLADAGYGDLTMIFPVAAAMAFVAATNQVGGLTLKAQERSDLVLLCQSFPAALSLTVGILATWKWGLTGACYALLAAMALQSTLSAWLSSRTLRRAAARPPGLLQPERPRV